MQGLGVLVTRPRHQAQSLLQLFEAEGARVVLLPTLTIEPLTDAQLHQRIAEVLPLANWLVFVSPNAVELGLAAAQTAGLALLKGVRLAAVGDGTRKALIKRGLAVDCWPAQGGGSDALLAEPQMQAVAGLHVAIMRGVGGRERLAEALQSRGARVTQLSIYRRRCPEVDVADAVRGWREGWLRFIIVTSVAGLSNLVAMFAPPEREQMLATRIVTVSERIAEAARDAGFQQPPVVASCPDDRALVAAVCATARPDRPPNDERHRE